MLYFPAAAPLPPTVSLYLYLTLFPAVFLVSFFFFNIVQHNTELKFVLGLFFLHFLMTNDEFHGVHQRK